MEEVSFNELLNEYLANEEEILWNGKPNIKIPIMIFVVVLFYCVFFAFIVTIVSKENSLWVNLIIYISFAIFGSFYNYMEIIDRNSAWKNTIYVVTNKRLLVVNCEDYKVIEKNIDNISCIKISEKKQGIGTIVFGSVDIPSIYYRGIRNSKALKYSYDGDVPIFNDINNVREVYKIVDELRDNLDDSGETIEKTNEYDDMIN